MDDEGRRCGGRCLSDSEFGDFVLKQRPLISIVAVPHRRAVRVTPERNKSQAYGKIVHLRFWFLRSNYGTKLRLAGKRGYNEIRLYIAFVIGL